MSLQARIETAISKAIGKEARFAQSRTAPGGCIHDSRIVSLQDGRTFFIKTQGGARSCPGIFACEFEALTLLAASGVIRVPRPVACGDEFIVLEACEMGSKGAGWHEQLGRQLAQLHHETRTSRFGFARDNYLGSSQQPNQWCDNWTDFWRDQRLGWQLHLFAGKASADDPLLQLGERLLARLDEILDDIDEAPVLLHGDLWSGNAAADASGAPLIYDPASYYGQREAEFGMMRLFGGFGPRCEAAYQEVWPLPHGAEERIALYRLYHELNHLNLFGRSYYASCMSTMRRFV